MKIDKVVMACDDNPLFLDFWPIVSKLWQVIFDIEPILLYFGDNPNISTKYGSIKHFHCEQEDKYLYTLWSRYWYPQNEHDKTFIISDIDMLPCSKFYFIDLLRPIPDDTYVHLTAHCKPLPSCYHIAKGKKFEKVLKLPADLDECVQLAKSVKSISHELENGLHATHWGGDEFYADKCVMEFQNTNPEEVFLYKRNPALKRIDRSCWHQKPAKWNGMEIYDCHSLRPYGHNKESIDSITDKIMKVNGYE